MDNLITVVIPTYNRADTIYNSIMSVVKQTYKNLEIIIVDDGSTDKTREIIKTIEDKRIKYIKQKNNGVSNARNKGIQEANGKLIAFQDSDDIWKKEKLTKQIELLKNEEVGMVYSKMAKISNNNILYHPSKKNKKKKGYLYNQLLKRNFIGCPTVLIRKKCLEDVGLFEEKLKKYEDWELFIRIAKKYKIEYCDEILVDSYFSDDGVNKFDVKDSINSLNFIIQSNINKYLEDKKLFIYAYHLRILNYFIKNHDINNSLKVFIKLLKFYFNISSERSWKINPKN